MVVFVVSLPMCSVCIFVTSSPSSTSISLGSSFSSFSCILTDFSANVEKLDVEDGGMLSSSTATSVLSVEVLFILCSSGGGKG